MSDSLWPHGLQHTKFLCLPPISQSLLKFMSIESVVLANHLILCHPLILLPPILPSIRVFSNESALCIRWPKYQSFSLSSSPSNESSGLISLRVDWFDLLAVQGSLKHHNLKAPILQCSAFFMSNSRICTQLLEKPDLWLYGPLSAKWYLYFFICCLGLS